MPNLTKKIEQVKADRHKMEKELTAPPKYITSREALKEIFDFVRFHHWNAEYVPVQRHILNIIAKVV